MSTVYDAVIIGGGHNGLVAACYLAKAGKKVLLLERNDYLGGAATSQRVFADYEASLSRYAYLVSLLPNKIIQDLGLSLELRRRRTASFTPFTKKNTHQALWLSNENETHNLLQIEQLGAGEYNRWQRMQYLQQRFAQKVWDSFLMPLQSKEDFEKLFQTDDEKIAWRALVEEPIGKFIESHIKDNILRGVVLTDAKIGAFTHAQDPTLLQNRTYLYHIIGNKTGEWRVPVGGMGAVSGALVKKATEAHATLLTQADVKYLHQGAKWHTVAYEKEGQLVEVKAQHLLINASPLTLARLTQQKLAFSPQEEGTAFKVNMLLKRLPILKYPNVTPEDAFCGTFHINQSYSQMEQSYREALAGQLPTLPPCEIYCHTLTDSSILSPQLAAEGYHTLTLFGLDMPYNLFEKNPESTQKRVLDSYLEGINAYLAEPLQDCLARDSEGKLCIEAKSAYDLEKELGLPRGNIFHRSLQWFFAENATEINQRGVETDFANVYLCGSSAKRGGAVSGIAGYHAAMKVLEN